MAYKHKRQADRAYLVDEPDWPKLIHTLRAEGFSMSGLGRMCDCTRQQLYSIMDGTLPPNWYVGQVLVQLYKEVVNVSDSF